MVLLWVHTSYWHSTVLLLVTSTLRVTSCFTLCDEVLHDWITNEYENNAWYDGQSCVKVLKTIYSHGGLIVFRWHYDEHIVKVKQKRDTLEFQIFFFWAHIFIEGGCWCNKVILGAPLLISTNYVWLTKCASPKWVCAWRSARSVAIQLLAPRSALVLSVEVWIYDLVSHEYAVYVCIDESHMINCVCECECVTRERVCSLCQTYRPGVSSRVSHWGPNRLTTHDDRWVFQNTKRSLVINSISCKK